MVETYSYITRVVPYMVLLCQVPGGYVLVRRCTWYVVTSDMNIVLVVAARGVSGCRATAVLQWSSFYMHLQTRTAALRQSVLGVTYVILV